MLGPSKNFQINKMQKKKNNNNNPPPPPPPKGVFIYLFIYLYIQIICQTFDVSIQCLFFSK